ncbi:hypothetical protein [Pseudoteredinibacter isoporae]|uniref:hypothetical protein n=1 Tax=Pseudoteredinibacter isoporae TaxID=570281 RepID=UPI00333E7736
MEIISSSRGSSPALDEWVSGHELFKEILSYLKDDIPGRIIFKARSWEGEVEIYSLGLYEKSDKYEYEVLRQSAESFAGVWVDLSKSNCAVGISNFYLILMLIFVVIVNIALIRISR